MLLRCSAKANKENFKTKIHYDINLAASQSITDTESIDRAICNITDSIVNSQNYFIPLLRFPTGNQHLLYDIKKITTYRNCVRGQWQRSRSDDLNGKTRNKTSVFRSKEFQNKLFRFKSNFKQLWSIAKLLKKSCPKPSALKWDLKLETSKYR